MRKPLPTLDKTDAPPMSMDERARALELACRAAAQLIASNPDLNALDAQEPLPDSSIRLLRRLARQHG